MRNKTYMKYYFLKYVLMTFGNDPAHVDESAPLHPFSAAVKDIIIITRLSIDNAITYSAKC